MLHLLAWRDSFPGYSHSDVRCRKIVAATAADGFTATEKAKFQVVARPDLNAGDLRPYDALNAEDLTGALLDLAPIDTPLKWEPITKSMRHWTQDEMDARA